MNRITFSNFLLVSLIFTLLTFTSCRSKQIGVKEIASKQEVSTLFEQVPHFDTFRSQIQIETSGLNAKGDLRVIKNSAIYLSVQAFLGIEVARLKITPDSLIAIDRLHRRYFADTFNHIYGFKNQGINYFTIQGLLTNTLFLQGLDSLSMNDVDAFRWEKTGAETELTSKQQEFAKFTLDKDFQLKRTTLGDNSDRLNMKWEYSDFTTIAKYIFPQHSDIYISSPRKKVSASLQFGRIEIGKQFQVDAQIPIRYSRVDLTEILKIFSEL
ncbi:MAG: DUF4292 domain-containing protein [Bacteroidales bacterium]